MAEQIALISAEMVGGAVIQERVVGFTAFVDMVLSFRRDSDCIQVRWAIVDEREAAWETASDALILRTIRECQRALPQIAAEHVADIRAFVVRRQDQLDARAFARDMAAQASAARWWERIDAEEARSYGLAVA